MILNHRFHYGRILALILLAVCGGIPSDLLAQAPTPPNILWISTEDLSPRLGVYGDSVARTPNLDQLAREGMLFENAFTTSPVCAPSRAAIITGMYQNAIGAHHMRTTESTIEDLPGPYEAVPPFYVNAFPEYLRAAGYFTSNSVKTDYQFGDPFTIWDELSEAAHWRNRPDPTQPFFSVINIMGTHEFGVFPQSMQGRALVTSPTQVEVPPYYPDTPVVREALARWYGSTNWREPTRESNRRSAARRRWRSTYRPKAHRSAMRRKRGRTRAGDCTPVRSGSPAP